ncbi:Flp family type IVb pilin [Nocardioides limicola]|uniref:Flp family type IVb pilin n=1 Tax=Nocardioides limicola TaxID=2803368 RepID=UPI00193B2EBA|nr:Flp family type IVb pilin [Nocardioides sp. DJM-14]
MSQRQEQPATAQPPSRVVRSESGASAVEYGLLIAGVAALIVAAVFILGGTVRDSYEDFCTDVATRTGSTC